MWRRCCALIALSVALGASPTADARAEESAPTLRVALTQEPGTLNPVVATLAVESDLAQFLYDGLLRYDEHGRLIPDLATAVPTRANGGIAADGRTLTYHLVRNARWHDGVALTAADVVFTFAALTNKNNNVVNSEPYAEIERVEAPDPYTVRVRLKFPWAPAIEAFTCRNGGAIVPAHLLAALPDVNRADFNAAPVGSGPYRFVAWHRGSDIELQANPQYFRGAPAIERVRIRFLTNDNTMAVALRRGEIDLADRLNITTYTNLGTVPGMLPAIALQSQWEHLTFNLTHPPLDDRRVRTALAMAIDVRELFAKVAHGLGALGPASQNPQSVWFDPHVPYPPFDPAKAAAMLDAAGWRRGPDGMRAKDGHPLALTLMFPAGNITRDQTAVILQQRWRAVGVDLAVKTFPAATFFAPGAGTPLYGGLFDIALASFVQSVADPSRVNVHAATTIPPHGNNLSHWADPVVDRLESEAAGTFDDAKRKRLYDRIQAEVVHELPYLTLRWAELTDMRSARLTGVRPPIVGSTFWNVRDWRFAP